MDTTKFKVGDEVKYVGQGFFGITQGVIIHVGHIGYDKYPYTVNFGDEDKRLVCSEDELELINGKV